MRAALQRFATWVLGGFDPRVFYVRLAVVMTALSVWVTVLALAVYSLWFPELLAGLGRWFVPLTVGLTLVGGTPIIATFLLIVGRLKDANAQLHTLSRTDSLTGLPNRRAFVADVSQRLAQAPGSGALLLLDLDHFKLINDCHGHPTGDEALRQIARVMRTVLRDGDCLGRVGGEEFGVFLPGADAHTAARVAERLRHAVAGSVSLRGVCGSRVALSVSVGGALAPVVPQFEAAYRVADAALYRAKQAGRDQVVLLPWADLPHAAAESARAV